MKTACERPRIYTDNGLLAFETREFRKNRHAVSGEIRALGASRSLTPIQGDP